MPNTYNHDTSTHAEAYISYTPNLLHINRMRVKYYSTVKLFGKFTSGNQVECMGILGHIKLTKT